MLKLFRRLFKQPVDRQTVVIRRSSTTLKVEEWRESGDCLTAARKVLNDPDVRSMLEVVRNSHVATYDMPDDATLEQRAIRQAEIQGFNLFYRMFNSLAVPVPRHDMPEPTWEAPDLTTTN